MLPRAVKGCGTCSQVRVNKKEEIVATTTTKILLPTEWTCKLTKFSI